MTSARVISLGGQVPCAQEVPPASYNLGWRTEDALFQRENTFIIERMVFARSISKSGEET